MGKIYHTTPRYPEGVMGTEWESQITHKDSQGNTLELARSATLIVAASNSSAKSKAGADYVCGDGTYTTDDQYIQAAIDALPANGGKVALSEGTFNLGAVVNATSGMHLCGQGIGITIITQPDATELTRLIEIVGAKTDIGITDLTLDSNTAGQAGNSTPLDLHSGLNGVTRLIIQHCSLKNGDVASWFDHAEDFLFADNIVDAVSDIRVSEGTRITYRNNFVKNAGRAALLVGTSTYVVVEGNIITNWGTIAKASAIDVGNSDYVVIANNVMYSGEKNGIHTEGVTTDIAISNNIIYDIVCGADYGYGIGLRCDSGSARVTVTGNVIRHVTGTGGTGFGIFVRAFEGGTIMGNYVEDTNLGGVYIESSGSDHCDYFSIIGNTLIDTAKLNATSSPIYLNNLTDSAISNNVIIDGGNSTNGIEEAGIADYNNISGNRIEGTTSAGVLLVGANSKEQNNLGYTTENSGIASNVTLDGSGEGVIAHGCDATPTYANVVCQSDNLNIRVTSIDATNINILVKDLDGAAVTADTHDFYWEAKVR